MATFYLDFENGNDANNGLTFANRWKTLTSGATAARIAPGDEIRMMGSPAPTSLGQNGTWTSSVLQATKSISSSTNATPISVTCTAHGYSTGDTVVITGHTVNTNANGTWEITNTGANTFTLNGSSGNGVGGGTGTVRLRNNSRVTLVSAVTQNIACTGPGRTAWTSADAVNVTTTLDTTDFKEHNQSDAITIGIGFTTGLAAYWPTGTLNLSGYQQVSFWIKQTSGAVGAAGSVDLRLCSDAAGVTAVNTISIPNLVVLNRWMPVTVDLATNLGSSIQSIALYVNTDNAAQKFLFSNIIACKASSSADSLTLTSLIGKNTTGETFWGIQSINGTRVMLDGGVQYLPVTTGLRGYYGTSETVTTWKREAIRLGPATTTSTPIQLIQDSGTDGSPITFSGGWNRTDMSTQTLETWLDGANGFGRLIDNNSKNWVNVSKVAFVRSDTGFYFSGGNNMNIDIVAANNNNVATSSIIPTFMTQTIGHAVANTYSLFTVQTVNSRQILNIVYAISSNAGNAVDLTGSYCTLLGTTNNSQIANNGTAGIVRGIGTADIRNIIMQDNSVDVRGTDNVPTTYLTNCLLNSATEVSTTTSYIDHVIYSQNHDQTPNNHKIFQRGALISSATDQRKTASGISWKIQPTNVERSSNWPISLSLAKIACAANSLVTVKAWMRRDNTGLTMRLVCKGGQIAGVTTDVVSAMTAAANTWEEETITFTPTEIGVVEITAEAWGGTTFSGWVDDMTITQA
jgi:hypothetical protein